MEEQYWAMLLWHQWGTLRLTLPTLLIPSLFPAFSLYLYFSPPVHIIFYLSYSLFHAHTHTLSHSLILWCCQLDLASNKTSKGHKGNILSYTSYKFTMLQWILTLLETLCDDKTPKLKHTGLMLVILLRSISSQHTTFAKPIRRRAVCGQALDLWN